MFEVRRIRLLVELNRLGTLAAVAAALNYSKASVSQQLAALEKEVGVALFTRVGRGVQLTPQGQVLAVHGVAVLDRLEEARLAVEHSLTTATGTLRLAVFQSAAHSLLPRALTLLSAQHPELRVEVSERDPETALIGVSSRDFDLILAEQYPGHTRAIHPELDHIPLAYDSIALALPTTGKTKNDPETALRRAGQKSWVMEPVGTASRSWAAQLCRANGFEPDVRYEIADLMAHVRLIRSGVAVGLLPELLWAGETPSLTLSELPGRPRREIFSCARRISAKSPAIRAVRQALSEVAQASTGK